MTQQEIDAAYQRGVERATKEAGILGNLGKSVKQMGLLNTVRSMLGMPVPGANRPAPTIATAAKPLTQFGQRNQALGDLMPGAAKPAAPAPVAMATPSYNFKGLLAKYFAGGKAQPAVDGSMAGHYRAINDTAAGTGQ